MADHTATESSVLNEIRARRWFYDFDLPSGYRTHSYLPDSVAPIHATRLDMLWKVLNPLVQDRWSDVSAIDVACHQGFFAINLARRGCGRVIGIDARAQHVADARLMARAYGLANLRIEQRDVNTISADDVGTFDIVVLFGLLYHVENPVGLLRLARRLTKHVCIVETQVAQTVGGVIDWGTSLVQRPVAGTFSLIDETDETDEPESGLTGISLCPSPEALVWVMRRVGFSRVEEVPPPPDAYEQFVKRSRVVVAGFVK